MYGALITLFVLGFASDSRAAFAPELEWKVLETPHFRITFYSGEREAAEHVADVCENVYDSLGDDLGWRPKVKTEIALTDATDSANGSATAIPYNAIRLYLTAPDDLSPLGDVDDWYTELVTHEYTHVVHLDHVSGIASIINAVLGKTYSPNQVQPRWILEGLATMEESHHTSGGRMRSSIWDMFMRTDVLQNNLATLDQMSNYVRRWPQGNIWYLYGSYFMRYILDTYGDGAIRTMIDDYGSRVIPWGINQAIRKGTGKTYEELYPAFIAWMQERYAAQAKAVRDQGLVQGTRITYVGQTAKYPRWIPKGTWPAYEGGLLYHRDDGHDREGLYAVPVEQTPNGKRFLAKDAKLLIRTSGDAAASFLPNGDVVFGSIDAHRDLFSFYDLHRIPNGEVSPSGHEGTVERLTDGFRAAEPTVSPDGRHVVFVTNTRGTRYLQIADIDDEGIRNIRSLVASNRWDQAFTPRFSPDGTHVAYSVWTHGGYRDIRIVDVSTGTFEEVLHDRAQDGAPSYSADGRYLFFHSDRTGIANVFAYDLSAHSLWQVTNVLTGAFYPEPSPDGKMLAYIGYGKDGFDLYAMPLDASTFRPAKAYVDTRPNEPRPVRKHSYEIKAYNPLLTMAPRNYTVQITPGNFGQMAVLGVTGADIAGLHALSALMYVELEKPGLQGNVAYTYGRLPVTMGVSAYRSLAPRNGVQLGEPTPRTVMQETVGVGSSLSYSKVRTFDSQAVTVAYSFARTGFDTPTANLNYDPYNTPAYPRGGFLSFIGLAYSYSNAERYLWSVSPERGFSFGIDANITDKVIASDYRGFSSAMNLTTYHKLPWLKHHVLALHGGAGISAGNYPGRGAFYVGGFSDLPILDTIRNSLVQGGIVLRGYEPVTVTGNTYLLTNAEYRFPIVTIDRGPSTLPIFLNRISGTLFFDYGSAFDNFKIADFKSGTGAEAWFDFMFGYNLALTFRLGYARGLASKGIDKLYFVAAVPY